MTQDELKQLVGQAAADYVNTRVPEGAVIGVGTGSTANCFIDALAAHKARYRGAVSSSVATSTRLQAHGIEVFDLNAVESLPVYVDGADEIDGAGAMIKGGGGALTREKIVASVADEFVCIVDAGKRVAVLGQFPLPVEVVPMARAAIARRLRALGGEPVLRTQQVQKEDPKGKVQKAWKSQKDFTSPPSLPQPYLTDNGNEILDVKGLRINNPYALEALIDAWPGVVTVGLFAARSADVCLLGMDTGVHTIHYRRK